MYQIIQKIFISEKFRYLFFGILTTFIYFFIRLTLEYYHISAFLSALTANITSIFLAFWFNRLFVFKSENLNIFLEFIKFIFCRISTLILDLLFAYILIDIYCESLMSFFGLSKIYISAAVALVSNFFIILLNYFLSKFFIFK